MHWVHFTQRSRLETHHFRPLREVHVLLFLDHTCDSPTPTIRLQVGSQADHGTVSTDYIQHFHIGEDLCGSRSGLDLTPQTELTLSAVAPDVELAGVSESAGVKTAGTDLHHWFF